MRLGDRFHWRLPTALLLLSCGLAQPVKADDGTLTLLFYERPPFHYVGIDHKPTGSVVEITARALTAAGLSFTWEVRPAKRVLTDVFEGRANVCSPGWYRTPDREEHALFSKPLLMEPPLVGVVRQDTLGKTSPDAAATFAAMSSILVRDHLTRGTYFSSLVDALPPDHLNHRTTTDIPSMMATVAAGHADLALMTGEEADYFQPRFAPSLAIVRFTNAGPPEGRYLLCSKRTDPALIARFNTALKTP